MRHLLAARDLSRDEILFLLHRCRHIEDAPALAGRGVCLYFAEPSTRTRVSFATAARRLGAHGFDLSPATSSLAKGESVPDTVRTVRALGAHVIVVRHAVAGFAALVARHADGAAVVNAGDGMHEHPTQALLDLATVEEALGRAEGLHVAIVGDVVHSRVARSHLAVHAALGNDVTLVGPPAMVPADFAAARVRVARDLDRVLPEADVLLVLRIQKERMRTNEIPSLAEYRALYGVDARRAERLREGAVLLHPGPMNVGDEITDEAARSRASRILRQVEIGVRMRMAVLEWVAS